MLKSLRLCVITLAASAFTAVAEPEPRCPYEAYTPSEIHDGIFFAFAEAGISILPRDHLVKSNAGRTILRGSGVVGSVDYVKTTRTGFTQLTFMDAQKRVLAIAKETVGPCPNTYSAGHCQITTFETELGRTTSANAAEFEIAKTRYGTNLRHFGKAVHPTTWRAAFQEATSWLVESYYEEEPAQILVGKNLVDRFQIAVSTDPYMIPYLPLITAHTKGNTVKVEGRVPSNSIYNRIVQNAVNAGLRIDTDIVIDTRILTPPILPSTYYGCGFEE